MKRKNFKSTELNENIVRSEYVEYVIRENFRDYGFISHKSYINKKSAEKYFASYVKLSDHRWGSSVKVQLIERKTVSVHDYTDFLTDPEFKSKKISRTTTITIIAK